jgi:hypothetical protein
MQRASKVEGVSINSGHHGILRPAKNIVSGLVSGGIIKTAKDIQKTRKDSKHK